MPTVRELKEDMRFNTELIELLDVMKNIAIFRFRALQRKKQRFEAFSRTLADFFEIIGRRGTDHFLMKAGIEKTCIIFITSDEGFMGGLNLRVIDRALADPRSGDALLVAVGTRGMRYLKEIGRKFTAAPAFSGYELALRLKDFIIKGAGEGLFGRVFVSYPRPISFMTQRVEITQVLPMSMLSRGREAPEGIASSVPAPPPRNDSLKKGLASNDEVIIESPLDGIIEYLVEETLLVKLTEILEDSKMSEFAARAIHLESSSRELDSKKKNLRLQYFRAYHGVIDKNTRELFSTQLIRRKG